MGCNDHFLCRSRVRRACVGPEEEEQAEDSDEGPSSCCPDPAALVVVFLSDPSTRRTLRYSFCTSSGVLAPLVRLASTPVPIGLLLRFHQFFHCSPIILLSTLARSATFMGWRDRWGKKPLKGRGGSRRVEWRFDIWKEARHRNGCLGRAPGSDGLDLKLCTKYSPALSVCSAGSKRASKCVFFRIQHLRSCPLSCNPTSRYDDLEER